MAFVTHPVQVRPLIHNVIAGLTYSEDCPVFTAGPGKRNHEQITGKKGTTRIGGSKAGSYPLCIKTAGLTEFEAQPTSTSGPGKIWPPDDIGGRWAATKKCKYDVKRSTPISWTSPRFYFYVHQSEEIL